MQINYNVLIMVCIIVGFLVFDKMARKGKVSPISDFYGEIKLALLLCKQSFRDDKVALIGNIIMGVVNEVETFDKSPEDKKAEAISMATERIMGVLNLNLDKELIETIVNIAVSRLDPSKK